MSAPATIGMVEPNGKGENQQQDKDQNKDDGSDKQNNQDKQPNEQDKQQQQNRSGMSEEQQQQLLDAIQAQEDKTQDKLDKKAKGVIVKGRKNW